MHHALCALGNARAPDCVDPEAHGEQGPAQERVEPAPHLARFRAHRIEVVLRVAGKERGQDQGEEGQEREGEEVDERELDDLGPELGVAGVSGKIAALSNTGLGVSADLKGRTSGTVSRTRGPCWSLVVYRPCHRTEHRPCRDATSVREWTGRRHRSGRVSLDATRCPGAPTPGRDVTPPAPLDARTHEACMRPRMLGRAFARPPVGVGRGENGQVLGAHGAGWARNTGHVGEHGGGTADTGAQGAAERGESQERDGT